MFYLSVCAENCTSCNENGCITCVANMIPTTDKKACVGEYSQNILLFKYVENDIIDYFIFHISTD